jgi:hypothetical protein
MRHARRLFAIVISCAAWCVAAATAAYAQLPPDPPGGNGASVVVIPTPTSAMGTPLWQFFATAALGVLLALAVVGLTFSLRHSRKSEPSRRREPTQGARA